MNLYTSMRDPDSKKKIDYRYAKSISKSNLFYFDIKNCHRFPYENVTLIISMSRATLAAKTL